MACCSNCEQLGDLDETVQKPTTRMALIAGAVAAGFALMFAFNRPHRRNPPTRKGKEIRRAMVRFYGPEKGREVFYASANAGRIVGVRK